MEDSFYITLSSKGESIYTNSNAHFRVELNQPLHFKDDLYEVALTDLILDADNYDRKENGVIFITCNLAAGQLYNSVRIPLLRHVYAQQIRAQQFQFQHLYYMPVTNGMVGTIEMNILDDSGEHISFLRHTSYCTLHIRKRKTR